MRIQHLKTWTAKMGDSPAPRSQSGWPTKETSRPSFAKGARVHARRSVSRPRGVVFCPLAFPPPPPPAGAVNREAQLLFERSNEGPV